MILSADTGPLVPGPAAAQARSKGAAGELRSQRQRAAAKIAEVAARLRIWRMHR